SSVMGRSPAHERGEGAVGEPGGSPTGSEKGSRGGNMVSPTRASRRRATSCLDDVPAVDAVTEDLRGGVPVERVEGVPVEGELGRPGRTLDRAEDAHRALHVSGDGRALR